MDHETTFIEAIRISPRDDIARQIYADWLEERGDPRGRYLRLVHDVALRLEQGLDWVDLKPVLGELCKVMPLEWREQVGKRFDVVLESWLSARKIDIIGAVRFHTGLGLKEAKDLVEAAPHVVRNHLLLEEAEQVKVGLETEPWHEHVRQAPDDTPRCRASIKAAS
jgi:uncharacterized protein (TIGR02996 family)